jgi:hypothetical protein
LKSQSLVVLGVCALILFMGCGSNNTVQDTTGNRVKVTRTLPATVRAGDNFTVSLTMAVDGKFNAVGLEEDYPPGWTVSDTSPKGVFQKAPDRIEWIFWSMGEPVMNRTISYTISAPSEYTGPAAFSGKILVTTKYAIEGDSSVNVVK